MEYEETLKQISKDPEFGEKDLPPFEDFLFQKGEKIKDPEVVALHAKRLAELRDSPEHKLTNSELAKICGCSAQAIGDIIAGKKQSVNLDYCNKLAQYFNCSAYYVLGVADKRMGVFIDRKEMIYPFCKSTKEEPINVVNAIQWAKIDPKLFGKLNKVFHHEDSSKRELLCWLIDEIF